MVKPSDALQVIEKSGEAKPAVNTLGTLIKSAQVKQRFEEMLGKKAAGFMSSILSVSNSNKLLTTADPNTILSAAAVAASLDLPINPSLGFAHIVPYLDRKTGKTVAQFQIGWRGLVQLAMRSGQYNLMNAAIVYEGDLIKHNRFTGEMVFSDGPKTSDKVIGYVAYLRTKNGFEKYLYMSREQAEKHGRRYSKSYDSGQWSKDFDAMALKTVLKMLLGKFGLLSIEMTRAIETDQAVIKEDGTPDYVDSGSAIDADVVSEDKPEPNLDKDGNEITM